MKTLTLPTITDINNDKRRQQLQHSLDNKTKPVGALGRLESLAVHMGLILATNQPKIEQPQLCIFAADHGLSKHGVSAYPSDVTAQMVYNFLQGGAAINVLARQHHIGVQVIDAGVNTDFDTGLDTQLNKSTDKGNNRVSKRKPASTPKLITKYKVRCGSRDALTEPAMTQQECLQALTSGMSIAKGLQGNLLIVGEMGIGNTSAASLLLARLEDIPISDCVGRGTGLNDEGLAHKIDILTRVLERHNHAHTPMTILAALGGLEIAMMVGCFIQAAHDRRILLIDGFIASVALLVAERLAPNTAQFAIFAHQSLETGHAHLLALLDAEPLLDFNMRLGEGSGAALAYPLLQSACLIINEMASFDDAGVSQRID